jgi:hypothetical protein
MSHHKQRSKKFKKIAEVVLTFTGAAIVGATYYVHTIKLEHAKELKARYEHVYEETILRDDISQLATDIGAVNAHIDRGADNHILARANRMWGDLYYESANRAIALRSVDRSIPILVLLALSLEDKNKYAEGITALRSDTKQLLSDNDHLGKQIVGRQFIADAIRAHTTDGKVAADSDREGLEEIMPNRNKISDSFTSVLNEQQKLITEITAEVKGASEAADQSSTTYTHWSYFLFALGFVVALFGKWLGLEVQSSDE